MRAYIPVYVSFLFLEFHMLRYSGVFDSMQRTRLWSMISTMVARRPAYGPSWRRTTRPTSTFFQLEALISAAIVRKYPTVDWRDANG